MAATTWGLRQFRSGWVGRNRWRYHWPVASSHVQAGSVVLKAAFQLLGGRSGVPSTHTYQSRLALSRELREATRAENREVQALAAQAGSILRGAGRGGSATQEERLAATLRAAAVDTEAADWLRRGVLTEELSPAGFGFGVGDAPATHVGREERDRAREQERSERERRRELEQELRAARETAARMEREADKAEERAREARAAANDAAARAAALAAEGGPK